MSDLVKEILGAVVGLAGLVAMVLIVHMIGGR